MELRLKLRRIAGNLLPVNYQYLLSSWIYQVIGTADLNYSTFLHERGFAFEQKRFKMFTFSQLDVRPYKPMGNQIMLLGNEVLLNLRFMVDSSMENFIKGLFMHQQCTLGDRFSQVAFEVTSIDMAPKQLFNTTMRYGCLSPIVTSTLRDDKSTEYLSPEDPRYGRILVKNLARKVGALALSNADGMIGTPADSFHFRVLNTPRKKGTTIKEHTDQETKVIAYLFHFELTAPVELHEVGYYAGFGEKNSMGFGCVNNLKESR